MAAMLASACTGGAPSQGASQQPSERPPATGASPSAPPATTLPTPSPAVSPSPSPVSLAEQDVVGDGAKLEPGVYTWSGFEPHVTFEVPEGWSGGHTHDDFFDVWNGAFVAFVRPVHLVADGGERIDAASLDPAETIEAIAGREGVRASDPFRTAVGGATGFGVDVTAAKDVPMFEIEGEDNAVPVPKGWRLRYRAVDVGGDTVLVAVGAPEPLDESDVAGAEDVVHTVEWGSGPRPVPMQGDGTPLDPGTYAHPGYEPGVSFDVGEGWTGGHLHDEFFDVQQERLLLGFADPKFLVTAGGGTVPVNGMDPAEAARVLTKTLGPTARPGDTCAYFPALGSRCIDAEPVIGTEVFGGGDGRLMLEAGSWDRLVLIDLDGELAILALLMSGGFDEEHLAGAEDVIRTVRWG